MPPALLSVPAQASMIAQFVMFFLSVWACFIASLLSLTHRGVGLRGTSVLSLFGMCLSSLCTFAIWYEVVWCQCEVAMETQIWFELGSWQVSAACFYDLLSAHMLMTVTSVSLAVHLYSVWYMRGDPYQGQFMSYLSLFTLFMQLLILSDNVVTMLVGWEGIGVCSYLLIGYWSPRLSASKSAAKAILVNRVSDGLLVWGVVWIWYHMGSLQYDISAWQGLKSAWMGAAVLLGSMGKSAQMLFQVWLADAMEGPTPVSGLIHAATLVTAGVYVAVRIGSFSGGLTAWVGGFTALMAAVYGSCAVDLKRTIAFSTCSQLGYMMVAVALGATEASTAHLMTHASFKAALFLAAGLAMHSANGSQHLARYGTTHRSHATITTLFIASLTLVGTPESSGFYSKETILNVCASHLTGHAVHTLLIMAAGLTAVYSTTLLLQCFCLDLSAALRTPARVNCWVACFALAALLLDTASKVWCQTQVGSALLPTIDKNLPLMLVLAGIVTATTGVAFLHVGLTTFCSTTWGFDTLYARSAVHLVLDFGTLTWAAGDRGIYRVG